jgi:hypothetical protein
VDIPKHADNILDYDPTSRDDERQAPGTAFEDNIPASARLNANIQIFRTFRLRQTRLETTVRPRSRKLAAERSTHRSDGHRHVLSRHPGLIAADVAETGVDVPLTCVDHVWGAFRIVNFIKRKRSLENADENGTGVLMPSRRRIGRVVMRLHYCSRIVLAVA